MKKKKNKEQRVTLTEEVGIEQMFVLIAEGFAESSPKCTQIFTHANK